MNIFQCSSGKIFFKKKDILEFTIEGIDIKKGRFLNFVKIPLILEKYCNIGQWEEVVSH